MSNSLDRLRSGLDEVRALLAANPRPKKGLPRFDVLRAIGRSAVVLTTSHLEAYIYGMTEEVVEFLTQQSASGDLLPLQLRLRHSAVPLEALASTDWARRERGLKEFFAGEACLWVDGQILGEQVSHERLLASMKTPRSKPLIKYFRDWGIDDVFGSITRRPTTRSDLFLRIDELGEKRNLIAHGDLNVQATAADIRRFLIAVDTFGSRVDKLMARQVKVITGSRPW